MYILGLTTMEESAAVLMRDGEILAGVEEERFTRVKHQGGFPFQSIRYVLESNGLDISDIDHVAVYWNPYNLGHRTRYMLETMVFQPSYFVERVKTAIHVMRGVVGPDTGWASLWRTKKNLIEGLGGRPGKIHFMDHHACHMASCFFPSDFDESAILIMDASGEAASTTWGVGRGSTFERIDEHLIPDSLGYFYSSVTAYLGFKMFDGEYKMMGLAPYGDPAGAAWTAGRSPGRSSKPRPSSRCVSRSSGSCSSAPRPAIFRTGTDCASSLATSPSPSPRGSRRSWSRSGLGGAAPGGSTRPAPSTRWAPRTSSCSSWRACSWARSCVRGHRAAHVPPLRTVNACRGRGGPRARPGGTRAAPTDRERVPG